MTTDHVEAKVSTTDAGGLLRAAGERREQRAREAVGEQIAPGVAALTSRIVGCDEAGRWVDRAGEVAASQPATGYEERAAFYRHLAELLQAFGCEVALAALAQVDVLRAAGPGRAVLLDGRGGCQVIDDPSVDVRTVHLGLAVEQQRAAVAALERERQENRELRAQVALLQARLDDAGGA